MGCATQMILTRNTIKSHLTPPDGMYIPFGPWDDETILSNAHYILSILTGQYFGVEFINLSLKIRFIVR